MASQILRTGPWSASRISIEVTVVLLGWLLGGTVGLGTVLYALAIGPLVQPLMPRLSVRLSR